MDNIDVTNQQYLIQALEGSVSTDDNHRKKCEEYLINFSLKEGSIVSLMRVMSNSQLDDTVRLAASIRLKNHVISHWYDDTSDYPVENPVIKSDRIFLLDNIYLCIVSSAQKTIRNQCYEILRHIMFNVCIGDFKTLLTSISNDLSQRSNSDRVLCALYSLRKVMCKYEYHGKNKANEVNDIISAFFGSLLSVALDASKIGFNNDEAATLIHLVLKIYFSSALLTSPSTNILIESLHHWMGLIKFVINEFVTWQQTWSQKADLQISMFSELSSDDEEYLCKLEQFKCFKWSLRILNRFMSRHNAFSDDTHKYNFYSSFITNNYSNENLVLMMNILKLESENKLILNNLSHHLIWSYLRNSLSVEAHFNYYLKDHLKELIGIYCLNTFKYTKEDVENYQEDPETYIQSLSDVCFQFYSNRGSCSEFLRELVKSYTVQSLNEIKLILKLGFESTDNTILYSVMSIIGYVSDKLIKKNKLIKNTTNNTEKNKKKNINYESLQIDGEELLELKVLSLLNSQDIWMRMRSAWLSGCILKRVCEFRNYETLKKVYLKLLELLLDQEILVAVFSANAIIELFRIENDKLQQIIVGSLSSLLERLFLLMNRIELESVTSVLSEIVDSYSHEVLPYAKDIIINISNNLTKNLVVSSSSNSSNKDLDEDERVLVRWSMLQTLNTVIRLLAPSNENNTNKDSNELKRKEFTEDKLILELNSYGIIINTVVNLLKLLFGGDDEGCLEYLDEAALLLANLVRLLDVEPVKKLLVTTGFSDFWLLFLQLLNLMRKSGFELVTNFSLVREPLVALARRDPQGFVKILDDFYRLCLEARNNGFGDEVDDVVADCLEVSLESSAIHGIFATILDDASTRVKALVSNYPKSNYQDLASDNLHLMRLSCLVILYYYQNFHSLGNQVMVPGQVSMVNQAIISNQNVLNNLNILTDFVVKYSIYCTWKSIRKYCILTCCTLLKNKVTNVDCVVDVLMKLLQNPRDDRSDDYKYSDSDSEYEDEDEYDDDYDDDSELSDYEFEDSPLNNVCEMKVAKQLLMELKDSLNQNTRDNLTVVLNAI